MADHHHHHSGCGCAEEMKDTDPTGIDLYGVIDIQGIQAFNEAEDGSAKFVIKPREDMLEEGKGVMRSDDDCQLVIKIPFSSKVKVKSITVIGGDEGTAPKSLKIYKDLTNVDFNILEENEPTQTLELVEGNYDGRVEYPLKITKFQNVGSITLGIDENYGAENTEIRYIGFKGENLNQKSRAVVAVYEASANLADHKNPIKDEQSKEI